MASLSSYKTLLDVSELIVDCEHKTAPTQSTGYPSIRTPNVGRGRLILDDVNLVSEETYLSWTRRATPRAGDLILAREAPAGNVAIVPENPKVCLGQRTVLIRPNRRQVDPHYLLYLLLEDSMQAKLLSYGAGATVPHVNMSDIRALPLPDLPTLDIQRKIAAILSAYDDLIEVNTRRIALLEEMARGLYREWFVRFRFAGHEGVRMVESAVGAVPDGWEVVTLGDIAGEVRRGVQPGQIDPETPYFGLEHLPRKSIALAEWGTASQVRSTKLAFKKGEILFGKIRPYFHKVGVAPVDGVCSSDTIVIVPKDPEHFAIVLGCVSSEEFVIHATTTSQGTKMPRTSWEVLVKYPIVVPPESLLRQYNEIVQDIVASILNMVFRNRNLRRTRDLLLPRLVAGEVGVIGVA
jgi:type I restriction enzyme S subunit